MSASSPASDPPLASTRWIGDQLHTSGVVAPSGGQVITDDFEAQLREVLERIGRLMEAHNLGLPDVASVTIYLASMNYFTHLNTVYQEFFKPPYPVRTTIECGLFPGVLVEISAIAYREAIPPKTT